MENSNFNSSTTTPDKAMSLFERIANSSILKMFIIFILILLMMIPMSMIDSLVYERKNREQEVSSEIALKWGKEQVISAPILAVPYEYVQESIERDAKGKEISVKTIAEDWIFLLPENSTVKTEIQPEPLKRGIYSAVVYNATVQLKGDFGGYDLKDFPYNKEEIKWSKAKLVFGIEDVKGLSTNPTLTLGDNKTVLAMNNQSFKLFPNNMVADVPMLNVQDSKKSFTINLQIRGSKSLNFLPLANQTNIEASGQWNNPSFNGGYLPEDRQVTENTFEATWGIPSFSRKLPAQWLSGNSRIYTFSGMSLSNEYAYTTSGDEVSEYGAANVEKANDVDMVQINFLPEVNSYQKINRVAKYGILIIVLTFASLFFTEIIKKQRVHLIQYILIGVAMVLFYSLLLAISEHLGFNMAYLLASVATVGLIASFIKMITKDNKTALLFVGILSLFYSFIFVLMQLRDYSLIVGTIGVFIILAVLMRVSTKVNWYQFDKK